MRLNVSAAAGGWTPDHPVLSQARHASCRSRCRIPASAFRREAAHHLRGVPAGRRQHQPQVRRHRARPGDQPRAGRACSAARSSCAARPASAARSRSTCRCATSGPTVRRPRTKRAPRTRGRSRRRAGRRSCALPERPSNVVPDDRDDMQPDDPTLLIVEDDPHYARILVDLAHDKGFKVLVAMRGADALALARQFRPTAVSLDVFLPDMLGWTVLSQLKQDPETRHIPVQIVTLDEDRQHGLARGAFSFISKPTTDRRAGGGASPDQGLRDAAPQAAAGRRGQRRRAAEHHGAARPRRPRHRRRRHRRGGAGRAGRPAVRLRGARPAAARHVRVRGARAHQPRRGAGRRAGRGLHRPRAVGRGGRAAPHAGPQRRGEGRRVARAAARRDVAVPAPGASRTCRPRSSGCSSGCTARTRTWSARRCWSSTTTCGTSSR